MALKGDAVLIEFRVSNFRSIRTECVLSMVAGRDRSLPGNVCHDKSGMSLLRTAAIYGPNASGKSNLVEAMDVVFDLLRGIPDSDQAPDLHKIVPFRYDPVAARKPSRFEVTFCHQGVRYQYGFVADSRCVHEEWLYEFPKGRGRCLFARKHDSSTKRDTWEFGRALRGEKRKLASRTRPDVLFLWVASKWNQKQLAVPHEWLSNRMRVIRPSVPLAEVTASMMESAKDTPDVQRELKRLVLQLVRKADPTVVDVDIRRKPKEERSIRIPPGIISAAFLGRLVSNYDVEFLHVGSRKARPNFSQFDESDGTRRIFELAGPLVETFVQGYAVVVDELERSLHPLLLRSIVEEFQGKRVDAKCEAQLIFATHDTTILDPTLLRRDQIWFAEKGPDAATHLYSLADYREHRARKGEALQKGYLAGRYGAIPLLERFDVG